MTDHQATIVVISGRPGAGKSTLARALATALPCPLVSRDEIFEGLRRTYGSSAGKQELASATFGIFFRTIGSLTRDGVSLVAEAAFQDHLWRAGLDDLGNQRDHAESLSRAVPRLGAVVQPARLRMVHCVVPDEVAAERVRQRPGPVSGWADPGRPFVPLDLPVPTLRVSTVNGLSPGLSEVQAFAGDGVRRSAG